MPITKEQVIPGLKVRVLRNDFHAHDPLDAKWQKELTPGDSVTLNGHTFIDLGRSWASYDMLQGGTNSIPLGDLELADAPAMAGVRTHPIHPDPAPHPCRCPMIQLLQTGCRCGGT